MIHMLELGYLGSRGIRPRSQQTTHLETVRGNCQNDILTVGAVRIFLLLYRYSEDQPARIRQKKKDRGKPPHQHAR